MAAANGVRGRAPGLVSAFMAAPTDRFSPSLPALRALVFNSCTWGWLRLLKENAEAHIHAAVIQTADAVTETILGAALSTCRRVAIQCKYLAMPSRI